MSRTLIAFLAWAFTIGWVMGWESDSLPWAAFAFAVVYTLYAVVKHLRFRRKLRQHMAALDAVFAQRRGE